MSESNVIQLEKEIQQSTRMDACLNCKKEIFTPLTVLIERVNNAFIMEDEKIYHRCEECGAVMLITTANLAEDCASMVKTLAYTNDIDIDSIMECMTKKFNETADNIKQTYEEPFKCSDCTDDIKCEKCSKWEQEELSRTSDRYVFDIDTYNKGR